MAQRRDEPAFLFTGPFGGFKDARFPQPKYRWDIPWTAEISESSVKRFLGEAKYYLSIYNVVVQHLMKILPFEKYFEEGSDKGRLKKKRDSFYAVMWNAQLLEQLMNAQSDEALAAVMPEDDEGPEEIDLEIEKSFQSLRGLTASSSSSAQVSRSISEVGSVQELLKPRKSHGPTLISKLKERLTTLLDEEVAKLKHKLQTTFPEYAEKKINKINKLVEKTINYSDYITRVEDAITTIVEWPAWDGGDYRFVDLREEHLRDVANHLVYAPRYIIDDFEEIFLNAYLLLKKTNDLEKVLLNKDPAEYAKLQEEKEKIPLPTGNDQLLDMS